MGRQKSPCGTEAAYRRHLRNDEPVDDACRDAHAAGRRADRRSPTAIPLPPVQTVPDGGADDDGPDDMTLIVDTLREAFKAVAAEDPTKLAPIAREFRSVVEATRAAGQQPKELSLAEQLQEARAARAARAQGQDASA